MRWRTLRMAWKVARNFERAYRHCPDGERRYILARFDRLARLIPMAFAIENELERGAVAAWEREETIAKVDVYVGAFGEFRIEWHTIAETA